MERSRDRPVASRDDTLAVVRVVCVEVLCIFDETRGGGVGTQCRVSSRDHPFHWMSSVVELGWWSAVGGVGVRSTSAARSWISESRVGSCRVGQWREGGVRGVGVEVAGVAWSDGRWRV